MASSTNESPASKNAKPGTKGNPYILDGMAHDYMPLYLRWWIKFRQFFQPYYRWYPNPKKVDADGYLRNNASAKSSGKSGSAKKTRKSQKKTNDSGVVKTQPRVDPSFVAKGAEDSPTAKYIAIKDAPQPLDRVMESNNKPRVGRIWCYHDSTHHQVIGCFAPGMGFAHKGRDGASRKRLKPLVYPIQDKPFDRTHLIPIGYHGSEEDPRLLIGWDSEVNRNLFNDFEQAVKKEKRTIYWVTLVEKTNYGARWEYKIYDYKTGKLLSELTNEMKSRFVWK